MEGVSAAIIGSTGAVGKKVVRYLVEYSHYAVSKKESDLPPLRAIYAYTRRDTDVTSFISADELNSKPFLRDQFDQVVKMIKINFDQPPDDFGRDINILYVCLGTTVAKDGREGQYRIDHDYAVNLSSIARKNGVTICALVSAIGANPQSRTFYSKMKGEIEEDIKKLDFPFLLIARPGLIRASRDESRPLETVFRALAIVDTCSYMSVRSDDIARAMIYYTLKEAVTHSDPLLESIPTAAEAPEDQSRSKAVDKAACIYLSSREMALTSQRFEGYVN